MTRQPRLKDVADLAGVSTATVSHVINGTRFVEPQTAERVRAAIAELHYVNNSWAKMLRCEKSNIIGLLIYDLVNPYTVTIANAALETMRDTGYQLYITPVSDGEGQNYDQTVQRLLSYRVAGVLSVPLDPLLIRVVHSRLGNVPMCCIGGDAELTDNIDTDHQEATRNAVKLLARKHKRIGFIRGGEIHYTTEIRFRGYQRALEEAGLPYRPEYVACGHSTVSGGYAATLSLLSAGVDALFVANDLMLQGAVRAIAETDSSLFGRLAIVGFDDPDWCAFYRPTITTIRQPLAEMVSRAFELLFARMQAPDRPLENCILPAQLIFRDSFHS